MTSLLVGWSITGVVAITASSESIAVAISVPVPSSIIITIATGGPTIASIPVSTL